MEEGTTIAFKRCSKGLELSILYSFKIELTLFFPENVISKAFRFYQRAQNKNLGSASITKETPGFTQMLLEKSKN